MDAKVANAGAGGPSESALPDDPWRWKYATTDTYLRLADNPADTEVRLKQTLSPLPWVKFKPGLTLRLPPAVRPASAAAMAAAADRRFRGVNPDDRRYDHGGWRGRRRGDARDAREAYDTRDAYDARDARGAGAWAPPPAVDPRVDVKVGGGPVAGRLRLRPPAAGRPSTLQVRVVTPLPGTERTVYVDARLIRMLPSPFAPPPPPPPPYGRGPSTGTPGEPSAAGGSWGVSPTPPYVPFGGGLTSLSITLRGVDAAFVKFPIAAAGVRFPARLGDRTKVLLRARKSLAAAVVEAFGGRAGRQWDKDDGRALGEGGGARGGVRLDLKYRLARETLPPAAKGVGRGVATAVE
ncbi:hypothetical protein MMPV_002218 [Pyropia vietnamensis]